MGEIQLQGAAYARGLEFQLLISYLLHFFRPGKLWSLRSR